MVNNVIVLFFPFHLSFPLVSGFAFPFRFLFLSCDVEQASKQVTGLIPLPIADVT